MIAYVRNNNHKFVVKWRLTTWCNYKCPYCFNTYLDEKEKRLTPESVIIERAKKINDLINNQIKEKTSLQLLGGEIMWYNIDHILEPFKKTKYIKNIQITSNFSAPLEKYLNFPKKVSLLTLSYHDSQVDFDTFFDKLEQLCEQTCLKIKVEFVANEGNAHLIPKIKERINNITRGHIKLVIDNEHNLNGVEYNNINSDTNNPDGKSAFNVKDDENTLLFSSKSDVLNHYSGLNVKGYYCSASMRHIEIIEDTIYDTKCSDRNIVGDLDNGFEKRIKKCNCEHCMLIGNISVDNDEDRLLKFLRKTKQK